MTLGKATTRAEKLEEEVEEGVVAMVMVEVEGVEEVMVLEVIEGMVEEEEEVEGVEVVVGVEVVGDVDSVIGERVDAI